MEIFSDLKCEYCNKEGDGYIFDHPETKKHRFSLCRECSDIFQNGSQSFKEYILGIILWEERDQDEETGKELDYIWYKKLTPEEHKILGSMTSNSN